MSELEKLLKQREQICHEIDRAWRKEFPIGSFVSWMVGKHRQTGIVSMHGHTERMKVVNERTCKELWIDLYRVKS